MKLVWLTAELRTRIHSQGGRRGDEIFMEYSMSLCVAGSMAVTLLMSDHEWLSAATFANTAFDKSAQKFTAWVSDEKRSSNASIASPWLCQNRFSRKVSDYASFKTLLIAGGIHNLNLHAKVRLFSFILTFPHERSPLDPSSMS